MLMNWYSSQLTSKFHWIVSGIWKGGETSCGHCGGKEKIYIWIALRNLKCRSYVSVLEMNKDLFKLRFHIHTCLEQKEYSPALMSLGRGDVNTFFATIFLSSLRFLSNKAKMTSSSVKYHMIYHQIDYCIQHLILGISFIEALLVYMHIHPNIPVLTWSGNSQWWRRKYGAWSNAIYWARILMWAIISGVVRTACCAISLASKDMMPRPGTVDFPRFMNGGLDCGRYLTTRTFNYTSKQYCNEFYQFSVIFPQSFSI